MSQVFHASLHRQDIGWGFRAMRSVGLLMSVRAHQLHHDTLTQDFSVINGWSNPVVNLCASFLLRIGALKTEGLEPT